MRIFRSLKALIYGLLSLVSVSVVASPLPLIDDPRLTYLNTENGLPQNSILALSIDPAGFLWVGTEEGLSRFDGHKVREIPGHNDEFLNSPITRLLHDAHGNLWVGSSINGAHRFDPSTGDTQAVAQVKMAMSEEWFQEVAGFLPISKDQIAIALFEQIELYNYNSQQSKTIYQLSIDEIQQGHIIRAITYFNNTMFVAQSNGLFAVDMASGARQAINYLPSDVTANESRINAKTLKIVDNTLFIGAVQGLYSLPLVEIFSALNETEQTLNPSMIEGFRNIWSFSCVQENMIYIGTDIGVYRLDLDTNNMIFLFEPKNRSEIISKTAVKNIVVDRFGSIWFGTQITGAMFWSPASTQFTNVFNAPSTEPQYKITDNNVWSLHQTQPNTLWIGTDNGLNKIDTNTFMVSQFLHNAQNKAEYTWSEIVQIAHIDSKFLWLLTGDGIRLFDIAQGELVDIPYATEQDKDRFDSYSWGMSIEQNRYVWSLGHEGFARYDSVTQTVSVHKLQDNTVNFQLLESFIGFDNDTNNILVGAPGKLYGFNVDTYEIKVLHSIFSDSKKVAAVPNDFLRDTQGNIWLSYPGQGLFKLHNDTWQTVAHFSQQDYLPTNLVYSLMEDETGFIWFSSHSGVHRFDPRTLSTESFTYAQGLSSSEFNSGANTTMSNGQFVYGGVKGITLFDPVKVIDKNKVHITVPIISEINLATRELFLPYDNLNAKVIDLEHDDSGISIHFSSLDYANIDSTLFQYRLVSNNKVVTFPPTFNSKVDLPSLPPGIHRLELFSARMNNNGSADAYVVFRVAHAPFSSPQAYLIYFTCIVILLGAYIYRRQEIQRKMAEANQKISLSNQRLLSALTATRSYVWEWSSKDNHIVGNRYNRLCEDVDINNRLAFDKHVSIVHDNDRLRYLTAWREFVRGQVEQLDITYRMVDQNGDSSWYRDLGSIIDSEEDKDLYVTGTYTNVTATVASNERLKLFGDAFEHTRDWVLIFDKDQQPLAANPSFMKAFSLSFEGNLRKQVYRVFSEQAEFKMRVLTKLKNLKPDERWKTELDLNIEGAQVTIIIDVNCIVDNTMKSQVAHYLLIMTDITEQKNAQIALQNLANYDVLTGLINRSLLLERIKQSIAHAQRNDTQLALLFIDLDGFKPINDTFGHEAGDIVIKKVANRIKDTFRNEDSVARIGGDEFVVMIEHISDIDHVNGLVEKLLLAIERAIDIGERDASVSASIGIAMYPNDGSEPEELLRNADIAMYAAKKSGKNNFKHFTENMNDSAAKTMLLQNKLKLAHVNQELINYYQPIVDLQTGKTAGFEMLLRWFDNGQYISPDEFIPIAEKVGLIVDITMLSLERVVTDLSLWYSQGFSGYVNINLSAKHFATRPKFEQILRLLAKYNIPVTAIRFEITETLLVENNKNTLDYMNEMSDLGFKICLDDYGTGYSSPKYLKDFPIDVLKIDKSFVDDVVSDTATASIIHSTLMMTELLALDTVAEGIERQEQVKYFKQTSCRYLQGYYFAKPVVVEECLDMLDKHWDC